MTHFFRVVSGILHPMLLPFIGTILFFQTGSFSMYTLEYKLYIEGIVLLTTGLLPGVAIWLLKKNGVVSDLDVSVRSERTIPYIIVLISYGMAVVMLIKAQFPWLAVKLFLGAMLAVAIAFFITLKWKISAHAMSFGCIIAAAIIICLYQGLFPLLALSGLFLMAGLQSSSRVYLKAHTLAQVILGFGLGALTVCCTFFLIP